MADAHKQPESSSTLGDRIEKVQDKAKGFMTKVEEAFKSKKEAMEKAFRSEKDVMEETFKSEKEAMEKTFESEKKAMEETFGSEMSAMSMAVVNDKLTMALRFKHVLQLKDESYAIIIREYAVDGGLTDEEIQDRIEAAKNRTLSYCLDHIRLSPVSHFPSLE